MHDAALVQLVAGPDFLVTTISDDKDVATSGINESVSLLLKWLLQNGCLDVAHCLYGNIWLPNEVQSPKTEQLGILLSDGKTVVVMAQVQPNLNFFDKALSIMELMRSQEIWFSRNSYMVVLQFNGIQIELEIAKVTVHGLPMTGLPNPTSCKDLWNWYMRLELMEKAKVLLFLISMALPRNTRISALANLTTDGEYSMGIPLAKCINFWMMLAQSCKLQKVQEQAPRALIDSK